MKIAVKRADAIKLHAHWLLYFHEVVQVGSIRGAARSLNVAPSVISRQLKEVEAIIGDRLLERVSKRLCLTAAGEVVAAHVNQVLRGLNHMQSSLDEVRGLQRGHVIIAAVPATAAEVMPRIVAPFVKKHPRITFECNFLGTAGVIEKISNGEADIGIAFDPPVSHATRHVIAIPVPFGAIMSPDHPLADRKTLRLYDLVDANVPLIFPDTTISTRPIIEDILTKSSIEVQPVITSSNREFVLGMAKAGAGVSFQTPVGIRRELREGSLVFIPLMEPGLKPHQLTVMVSALRPPSLIASVMTEAARAGVAELLK